MSKEIRQSKVAQTFQEWLASQVLILDTETSGIDRYAEIVEIAVIDTSGQPLVNTRICPRNPNQLIETGAFRINGIHPDVLRDKPSFPVVYESLISVISGRSVVIYNADFDTDKLLRDCRRWGLPEINFTPLCAMKAYSEYVGDWSEWHGNYKWQKLPFGDHSALGDARGTLQLMKHVIDQVSK